MLEIYASQETKHTASRQLYRVEEIEEIQDDCWVNLYSPTEAEIAKVETELSIPQEFLRYPLDEEERPRIDYDDDTGIVLVIIDVPYTRRDNDIIKYETTPLGIILADKHIVTVSLRQTQILDHFIDNRIKDLYLAYRTRFTIQILFAVAREYLRLLRFIDKTLEVAENELEKIALALTGVTENQDIGRRLIFGSSVKIDQNIRAELIAPNVQALGIGFAGEVERIEIGNRA